MLKEFAAGASPDEIDAFIENFDHHSLFFRQNYYNIIRRLTDRGVSVLRSDAWNDGFSIITSYDMIRKITDRPDLFTNQHGSRTVPRNGLQPVYPSDLDGADQAWVRQALKAWFAPRNIASYLDGVNADVAMLRKKIAGLEQWDWVTDFAQHVTGRVSMRLLGLVEDEWPLYADPIHINAFCIGPIENRIKAGMAFSAKVHDEVERLCDLQDAPGLIPFMAQTEFNGRRFTRDEIEAVVLNIIIGGLETTQATFGCVAAYLGRNPDRKLELREKPEMLRTAMHEFLRIFASATFTGRYVEQDTAIGPNAFQQGETALIFWPAANFDPAFVQRPFDVDFTRSGTRLMTFASGPHQCLGQHLSRLELEPMIRTLVETDYALVEDKVLVADNINSGLAFQDMPARHSAVQ